jgi:hypothetical protein
MIAALLLAATFPGLFAPASAAGVIGVEALDPAAKPAAMEIVRQLAASRSLRPLPIDEDPSASDCRAKPYAAAARIATDAVQGAAGWTFDVGLQLVDCAGWSVEEWHDAVQLSHPPEAADAEKLGIDALIRLRTWMAEQPVLSRALFTQGLAYDPASATPMYLYALFKTDDGNMRAYVRPGGPAYAAGLRTNDVVDKLDGKYWWEYGTYQTERRAYDGRPHVFEVTRGKQRLQITLGAPFVAASGKGLAPAAH